MLTNAFSDQSDKVFTPKFAHVKVEKCCITCKHGSVHGSSCDLSEKPWIDCIPGNHPYPYLLWEPKEPAPITPQKDDVNHPSHYTQGTVECIEAMEASSTPEQFVGYLKNSVVKYIWRVGLKDDSLKDLKKAQWYLNRLINFMENK